MRGSRIVSGLFLAALSALFVWAVLTGAFRDFLTDSARFFGIENHFSFSDSDGEDVLFDDDSTVDWSSPATDVFDGVVFSEVSDTEGENSEAVTDGESEKFYELALTPEYFCALLKKYSDGLALKNITASFSDGRVILSGDVCVAKLTEQMKIPAALVVFLPEFVPCTLDCALSVEEQRLTVTVTKVSAESDVLTPFLGQSGVLSAVENFLNEQLTKYLSSNYKMQSVRVTETGMYVRFSVE
ncbi:MAG: hypothetical protein J6B86_07205 [Clostridia bacterium]|nr:hypothetical protein [Clostridia bacterium]